jgi:hypothetical protein
MLTSINTIGLPRSAIFILLQLEDLLFEEQIFFSRSVQEYEILLQVSPPLNFATFNVSTEKHRILESTSARLRLGKKKPAYERQTTEISMKLRLRM